MEEKIITRRDFLRVTAGTAVAATLGSGIILGEARTEPTAKVVLIRNAEVLGRQDKVQEEILQSMLDEAVKSLLGTNKPLEAWQKLFKSSDVVGIKSNVWNKLPTPKELEAAIKRRLLDVGVAEKNIGIDDREVLNNPVFLNATALVNVRPLRTHHWSGVGTCLKNYIQFVPDPSSYHDEGCSPLGKIWTYPIVKGKTRLNILSALTPQFYGRGANFFDKRYVWPYKGLIVGADPVAVDAVGAHLIQVKRIGFFGEDRALDVPPIHIMVADKKYHLGVSDLSRIQLIKIGWMEEALI
ncbi:MAG: hypothetical protein COZ69_09965 [Deltaproteobacteria bacterium CG_4_8_14_3_um_filter_45_9]|nr:MAG: hypothetical protein COS40_01035 [Deltaproteobacteria bacterium CG03_land_8_20_14_0_80_45_14]PIX22860.1 MAG: hypothetical protein COZ69_09965 [Deltaproteobacteria bacterium CG_4_8_14_3_um_filter_45_9]